LTEGAGQGEHSWLRILASTKPYRVEACSGKWLNWLGTCAWRCQTFMSVPVSADKEPVGLLFLLDSKHCSRHIQRISLALLLIIECYFYRLKINHLLTVNASAFILGLGSETNRRHQRSLMQPLVTGLGGSKLIDCGRLSSTDFFCHLTSSDDMSSFNFQIINYALRENIDEKRKKFIAGEKLSVGDVQNSVHPR
jgi:hypothetical protein